MRRILLSVFAFTCLMASPQDLKPRIGKIVALPSEPPLLPSKCTASRSGYLEKDGRTSLTKAEIGDFVDSSLRDGYVLTIYPQSKRGIFVDMGCDKTTESSRP